MLIIKTRESLFESVRDVVCSIHSYELPEILCVPVTHWNQEVHAWIMDTTVQQHDTRESKDE